MLFSRYYKVFIARAVGPISSIVMLYLANVNLGLNGASNLLELLAFSAVVLTLSLFGLQQLLLRESANVKFVVLSRNVLNNLFLSILIYILVMIFVVGPFREYAIYDMPAIQIIIVFGGLNMISRVFSSILIGTGFASTGLVLSLSMQNIFLSIFLIFKTLLSLYILVFIWALLLVSFYLLMYKRNQGKEVGIYKKDRHLFIADSYFGALQSNIVPIILGGTIGGPSVAIFSIYSKLASIIPMIGAALNAFYTHSLVLSFKESLGNFKEEIKKISIKMAKFSIPPILLLVFVGKFGFDILSDKQADYEISILMVLAVGQVVNVFLGPVGLALNISKNMQYKLYSSVISFFMTIALFYLASIFNQNSVFVAALIIALAIIVNNLLNFVFLNHFFSTAN